MNDSPKVTKCYRCGATSYRHVLVWDELGKSRKSGKLSCDGCEIIFTDVKAWREGSSEEEVNSKIDRK